MDSRSAWADFFDGHAPQYDGNSFTQHTQAEVDFLIAELGLALGQAVLDVGCGTGRHAVELARRGLAVTGVDLSPGMLAEARRRAANAGVRVTWIEADATAFALPEAFDAAVCLCEGAFGLLGNGDDPIGQPLAILRNIAAAMQPGAKCLFTVLNGYAIARKHTQASVEGHLFDPLTLSERSACSPGEDRGRVWLRERGFIPTELRLLFSCAGLTVLDIWGGTAGNWGKRPILLDEIEIMVVARKGTDPATIPEAGAPA